DCILKGGGKQPLRVYELTQLPLDTLERILGSDKLGLAASSGDERLVLRTCTNVLRQRMSRSHAKLNVEIVKPLEGAVEAKVRVVEGIASGSECVRGDPVPRYEKVTELVEGEEGASVEVAYPVLREAPLGEVWAEVEWKGTSGGVTVDELSKEIFRKLQQGDEEEEEEVTLASGAVVRVSLQPEEEEEVVKEEGREDGEVDKGDEEDGDEEEGAEEGRTKKAGPWAKEDFETLYNCVRWSQLPLEALISAAESPLWRPAQDRILEYMRRFTAGQEGGEGRAHKGRPRECQRDGYKRQDDGQQDGEGVDAAGSRGSVQTASAEAPVSFAYSSDFDSFGSLYWLGTRGHTIPWRNPASKLMEVQVAASSVGRGSVEDIVGRSASADFRTKNEPSSWIQVDFGRGRALRLSGYCLRNRNSSAQCLMSWNLMGSNDGEDWIFLDERKICGSLREPKATSYFPIEKSPESRGAFRMFRLIQSGVNSGNTHNLFLAGVEFYGQATAGECSQSSKNLSRQYEEAEALWDAFDPEGGFMWLNRPDTPEDGEMAYSVTVEGRSHSTTPPTATFIITILAGYPGDGRALPEILAVEGSDGVAKRLNDLSREASKTVKCQLREGYEFPLLAALEAVRQLLTEPSEGKDGDDEAAAAGASTIDDMSVEDILRSQPTVLGRRMLGIVHIRNKEHMKYCRKLANEWHLGGMGNPNAIVLEGDERLCIKYTDIMIQ
ncbi:hypothetical protein FOL46_009800, partial [Perkinsus olseni]